MWRTPRVVQVDVQALSHDHCARCEVSSMSDDRARDRSEADEPASQITLPADELGLPARWDGFQRPPCLWLTLCHPTSVCNRVCTRPYQTHLHACEHHACTLGPALA